MNPQASYNLRRTLVAIFFALAAFCVGIPLIYDFAGVRTNLEENIAPTLVAQMTRKTRVPRTVIPTLESSLFPTPAPTDFSRTPLPTVAALNGIPIQRLAFISASTREHLRDIYAFGQSLGRNPRALSKVGDSTMVYPPFLVTFDRKNYRLGKFAYLQATIDFHSGSFGRTSVGVKKGMHTWSQFDPAWAIPELCAPDEGPLACELRLQNPSIAIIRLGANDTEFPSLFERNLGTIVKYCLARGIIPVLGTKPDRYEGESNLINNLIRKTASAYAIPLWDYDLIAGTVPGRGLEPDGLHMVGGGTRDFGSRAALQAGDTLEDLTALMVLDAIRRELGAELK
jgi:hypothetical protein